MKSKLAEIAFLEASMLGLAMGASGNYSYNDIDLLNTKYGPTQHYEDRPANNNVEYYVDEKVILGGERNDIRRSIEHHRNRQNGRCLL